MEVDRYFVKQYFSGAKYWRMACKFSRKVNIEESYHSYFLYGHTAFFAIHAKNKITIGRNPLCFIPKREVY